jgi:DNA primase
MFPIHDARGRAVGFGGRSLDGREPKYINSPESEIYSKGTLLYRLHEARYAMRKADRVLVVEGYFDAVRTAAAGVDEVVAPLGTALTPEQAALLRRYTPNVFLLYDSDTAGLKATFRAGDALLRERATVQVVSLPDGEDPDTFVAQHGSAGLDRAIGAAVDVFERKLQLLQRGGWFADLGKSRKAIDKLLPTIRAAADHVTRDLYLTRAAHVSGVDRDTLAHEAAQAPNVREAPQFDRAAGPRSDVRGGARRPSVPVGAGAERALVRAMLSAPDRVEQITEAIAYIDDEASTVDGAASPTLRDARLRAIHEALLDAPGPLDVARLADVLPPDAVALLEELLAEQSSIVRLGATIDDSLTGLKARWRQERIAALRARGAGADPDALNQEILRLKKEIQALGRRA